MERQELVFKDIEEWLADEEKLKTLDRATVEELVEQWLTDFTLVQPG